METELKFEMLPEDTSVDLHRRYRSRSPLASQGNRQLMIPLLRHREL